jgi:2-polyprenyl-3-methyl-5-hydroxy-6-metoxy-1,4-benzoquinol methylase
MLKEVSKQFLQRDRRCPICSKTQTKKFWAMSGYALVRCFNCGMVWDPFPSEKVELLYDKNYFLNDNPKGGYANYFEGMNINKKTFYERIKRINKKVTIKDKMLDVGSALGDSLVEARKLGWKNLYGVELSDYAAGEARKKKLKINVGTIHSAGFPDNYFDAVTIQDVIEHVRDPRYELKEVFRIMKPGGCIFVVTPDVGGIWAKILGRLWYHYKPGEHIMYFTQNSLSLALCSAGFKNVKTKKTYHIMSTEYILNRLRYYSPVMFGLLLWIAKNSFLGRISFRVYSGEIEAWGQK